MIKHSKCPLCGGEADYVMDYIDHSSVEVYSAGCETCGMFPPIMRAKIDDLIEACPYAGECNYEPKKLYIHGVDREKNTVYVADVKPNKKGTLIGFSFFDAEMPAAYVDKWNLEQEGEDND